MRLITAFRCLSLPHLATHRIRTLITVLGIALGVAGMVGLRMAYEPITRSYERSLAGLAGKAAFQIANGDVGVPEEVLDDVARVPGVGTASASVQGFLPLAGAA